MNDEEVVVTEERFRRFERQLIIVFSVAIVILALFISVFIVKSSSRTLRDKVSYLIDADAGQLKININSYLENIKSNTALLFAEEEYYEYDETDSTIDEYDRIKIEDDIADRIVDIGLMENYADLAVIYSDDHSVGWLSKTTSGLFPDGGIYDEFAGKITDEDTEDAWCCNVQGNVDRMYYVKRLNENAIILASIYNRELDSVFDTPEQLRDMVVCLVNDDNDVLFSSDSSLVGEKLNDEIANKIENNELMTEGDYLISENVCENGWRLVSYIPVEIVLRESKQLYIYIFLFATFLCVLFSTVGLLLIKKMTHPMDGMLVNLARRAAIDELTGLYNKRAYKEHAEAKLNEIRNSNSKVAFMMIDMDNFKQVNDKAGHQYGDDVISRMGNLLHENYGENAVIGRVGGDEFSVLYVVEDSVRANVDFQLATTGLIGRFDKEFAEESEKYNTSISVGVAVKAARDANYDDLYRRSDRALYKAKKSGKHKCTFDREV